MRNLITTIFATLFLASGCQSTGSEKQTGALGKNPDFGTLNVCDVLPGDSLAIALGGRLSDVRPLDSGAGEAKRCRYTMLPADTTSGKPSVFVVYLQRPADFDTLKTLQEDPIDSVYGLGDDAFISYHSDTARHDLYVLKRERYMIEITGDDRESIRKIAEYALGRL